MATRDRRRSAWLRSRSTCVAGWRFRYGVKDGSVDRRRLRCIPHERRESASHLFCELTFRRPHSFGGFTFSANSLFLRTQRRGIAGDAVVAITIERDDAEEIVVLGYARERVAGDVADVA